jgi:hypothetical protein
VHETPAELARLQQTLDESAAGAGPHLSGIVSADRRVDAATLCARLTGMRILVVATVTADGRPLVAPVDGYFLHGAWFFSTSPDAVRAHHLTARPAVSATYTPAEEFSVTVHGRAELFDLADPARPEIRQAMLDHYLPTSGEPFRAWVDGNTLVGARIEATKIFTYSTQ